MLRTLQREQLRLRKKAGRCAIETKPPPAEFSWTRYADTRLQQMEEASAEDAQHVQR